MPFCGRTEFEIAIDQVGHNSYIERVKCDSCQASFSTQYTEISEALAAQGANATWTRRAAASAQATVRGGICRERR